MRRPRALGTAILVAAAMGLGQPARAAGRNPRGPLLLARRDLAGARLFELQREAASCELEVAAPEPRAEPASEAVLADVRPLYRDMAWSRCGARLDAGIESLIRAREPTPGMVRAVAELELWRGACRLLAGDARARDDFLLAKQLWPPAKPEPIFPPRVHAGFRAARAERPINVTVRLAPVGAHLWVDGRLVHPPLRATPGLHYVVVTRADFAPEAQFVRLGKGMVLAVSLREAASVDAALRAARWNTPADPVAPVVRRPVFLIGFEDGRFSAASLQAAPGPVVESASAGELVAGIAAGFGGCPKPEAPPPSPPPLAVAPSPAPPLTVAAPPPPRRPVWKRGWFWGVLGVGVAARLGIALGVGLGVTAPSDYVVRVR
jgi:hypothetical protein